MLSWDFLKMLEDFTYRRLQDFSIWLQVNINLIMFSIYKMVKYTLKILQQIVKPSCPMHFRKSY